MSSFAADQRHFMRACDQSTGIFNWHQAKLYRRLVAEEAAETAQALVELEHAMRTPGVRNPVNRVAEVADGAIDTIYVCFGLLQSLGVDIELAWDTVHASNLRKLDPDTGKLIKDAGGKVLKPEGWEPPDMVSVVRESWGM